MLKHFIGQMLLKCYVWVNRSLEFFQRVNHNSSLKGLNDSLVNQSELELFEVCAVNKFLDRSLKFVGHKYSSFLTMKAVV